MQNSFYSGLKFLAIALSSVSAFAVATPAKALSFGADLSPDSINFIADTDNPDVQLNYAGQVLLTEDEGNIFAVKAYYMGDLQASEALKGGLGVKLMHADVFDDSFQALGLGGFLDYTLPSFQPVSFRLEAYYSPDIVTSDYPENVTDITFTASYKAFENALVYVGLRDITVSADNPLLDGDVDSTAFIGFKIQR